MLLFFWNGIECSSCYEYIVQEALTEANEALTRQGLAPKRDLEPIDES